MNILNTYLSYFTVSIRSNNEEITKDALVVYDVNSITASASARYNVDEATEDYPITTSARKNDNASTTVPPITAYATARYNVDDSTVGNTSTASARKNGNALNTVTPITASATARMNVDGSSVCITSIASARKNDDDSNTVTPITASASARNNVDASTEDFPVTKSARKNGDDSTAYDVSELQYLDINNVVKEFQKHMSRLNGGSVDYLKSNRKRKFPEIHNQKSKSEFLYNLLLHILYICTSKMQIHLPIVYSIVYFC